jgi:hypothetical protein
MLLDPLLQQAREKCLLHLQLNWNHPKFKERILSNLFNNPFNIFPSNIHNKIPSNNIMSNQLRDNHNTRLLSSRDHHLLSLGRRVLLHHQEDDLDSINPEYNNFYKSNMNEDYSL